MLVLAVSLQAEAATYYVSNSGNDSNPGSAAAPWRYCPGMEAWGGGATLQAGDTVFFNKAGAWTSANQQVLRVTGGVTYDGMTWGSGSRATFRAAGDLGVAVVRFSVDHASVATVLRGFHVDGGSYEATGVGMGWPVTSGNLSGAVKRIENCLVHDCGSAGEQGYNYGILIGALSGYATRNVEVLNCVVYNTGRTAIGNYVSSDSVANLSENVLIRGCEVYNSGESPTSAGFAILMKNHVVNTVVEFNYVHDSKEGIGIETSGSGFTGPENAKVRYNVVRAMQGSGLYVQNAGAKSFDLYENLVLLNQGYGLLIENTTGNITARIYNNTFYQNCASSGSSEWLLNNLGAGTISIDVRNNIISAASGRMAISDITGGRVTAHGCNLYYRPDGGTLVRNGGGSYSASNLTSWEASGVAASPGFKNTSALPSGFVGTYGVDLQPNADGLSIASAGSAVGRGQTMASPFTGAINLNGASASAVREAPWDIGAYETESVAVTVPFPPSNLRVVQ